MDLENLVGQVLTDEMLYHLRGTHSKVRVKKPGSSYTQESKPFRLNIVVDENNIVTGFHFG